MKIADLCNIHLGNSKYSHAYFKANVGMYPVYSSQTSNNGIIATIPSADFVGCTGITWTKDGIYAGTVFKRVNETFSLTTHCGFLEIKPTHQSNVLLDYLFLYLAFNLKEEALGSLNKRVTQQIMNDIDIPHYANIPAQQIYIDKYSKIHKLISVVKIANEQILNIDAANALEKGFETNEYIISDLIDIGSSNAGFLTQKFVNSNKGNIPVYGASEADIPSYGYIKDSMPKVNYFEDCFRYNRNGSFGVFVTKGRFTISNDVRAFKLKPIYIGLIDPDYLAIKLKDVYFANNLSYGNKAGKDKFLSLSVRLVDLAKYSKDVQTSLALKFKSVEQLKHKIISEMNTL